MLLAGLLPALWSVPQAAPDPRSQKWSQDLDLLAREFPSRQLDFQKLYPAKKFETELQAIKKDISVSSDAEIVMRLKRLVASAHVGHTAVQFPKGEMAFHRIPLVLSWYSDGLVVTDATAEYNQALGARVSRIGGMPAAQVEAEVAPYISYENELWLHLSSPRYMTIYELLAHLHLSRTDGRVDFVLVKLDGSNLSLTVVPVEWSAKTTLITAVDALHLPVPLFRKQPGSYYWYEYLADSQTLYLQYNVCADDPKLPFQEFSNGLFTFADAHPIQRTVVDLRFNQGGNSRVIGPLLEGLKARKNLSAQGRLFALIGRATFSSGFLAALNLRNDLHAILVGEPTGEKPNSYGEVRELVLPNSGLVVTYSTKFFRFVKYADPPFYAPDIQVTRSLADLLAGRDPVLDAAMK